MGSIKGARAGTGRGDDRGAPDACEERGAPPASQGWGRSEPPSVKRVRSEPPPSEGRARVRSLWAALQSVLPFSRPAAKRADEASRLFEKVYGSQRGRVWRKLVRYVTPDVAEDLCQDVFVVAYQQILEGGEVASHEPTVAAITRNLLCNHLRRQRNAPWVDPPDDLEERPSAEPNAEERLGSAEALRGAQAILAAMKPQSRMLIQWLDIDDETHEEAARRMDCPIGTAKTRHRAARAEFFALVQRIYTKDDLGGDR